MSASRQQIQELFQKLVSNQCTKQETETFFQLAKELPADDMLIEELNAWWQTVEGSPQKDLVRERRMLQLIKEQTHPREALPVAPVRTLPNRRTWWAAACVGLLVATGAYIWFQQPAKQAVANVHKNTATDIEPGKDGAILTLEDGSQVILDSLTDGLVASQRGAEVLLKNGRLSYNAANKANSLPAWNTISTPKGRQFKIQLPDGTQVWLNAASSVTYPTFFAGHERKIEVTGEVYLEVAKNAAMPFKMKVNNQAVVEVMGTHFNVKAYTDEAAMTTTLLEGSVKMYPISDTACWHCPVNTTTTTPAAPPATPVTLKPGQQGVIATKGKGPANHTKNNANILVLNNVNTDQVMAWKNGLFNFEGASLKEVMNQLKRWYNIDVVYDEAVPNIQFFGEMSRNISLADLLKVLKDVGVQFRIESDRKLIVLPE